MRAMSFDGFVGRGELYMCACVCGIVRMCDWKSIAQITQQKEREIYRHMRDTKSKRDNKTHKDMLAYMKKDTEGGGGGED